MGEKITIGSEEWIAHVKNNYKFPCIIGFYYTNKNGILTVKIKSKAEDVGNIKYEKVAPPKMLSGEKMALLGVHQVCNVDSYLELSLEYRKEWKK